MRAFVFFVYFILLCGYTAVISAPVEKSLVTLLEEEVSKLPKEFFDGDGLLIQSLDSSKKNTIYKCSETGEEIFFRENEDDSGKSVIVLQNGEDFLPSCNSEKKTHVMLVKNGEGYNAVLVYLRESLPTDKKEDLVELSGKNYRLEWDISRRRVSSNNKAKLFGWTTCSYSSLVPCKELEQNEVPHDKTENSLPKRDISSDFMCDLAFTNPEANFVGGVVSALNTAVTILNGANMIYTEEMKLFREISKDVDKVVKANTQKGRAFGMSIKNAEMLDKIGEIAAGNVMDKGRDAISTGVLMFFVIGATIGELSMALSPNVPCKLNEKLKKMDGNSIEKSENATSELKDAKATACVYLGRKLLAGFTDGNSRYGSGVNPDPTMLLNLEVAKQLTGSSKAKTITTLGRSLGRSGNSGTRILDADNVRDGSVTGSIAADTWNGITGNLQTYGKKSAGQVFSENIRNGAYLPHGAVEDVANQLGHLLGNEDRVSDDRSIVDDFLDKATTTVASAGGAVIDVAADLLAPLGLSPLAHTVSAVGSTILGAIGGGAAQVVLGPYQLIKTCLKTLGAGGLIGMKGSKSRVSKAGGIVNSDSNGPTQAESDAMHGGLPTQVVGHGFKGEGMTVVAGYKPESGQGLPSQLKYGQGYPQGMAPGQPMYAAGAPAMGVGYAQGPPQVYAQGPPMAGGAYTYARAFGRGIPGEMNEDDIGLSQSAMNIPIVLVTNVDLFSYFGWRSMDTSVKDLASSILKDSFIGFGNCPQRSISLENLSTSKQIIDYYMTLMRTDCLKKQQEHLEELFDTGIVRMESDKTISVVADSALLTKKKLTIKEIGQLSKAFEIAAFSKTCSKSVPLKNPFGDRITTNVGVIQSMTIEYLEQVRITCPAHAVKLVRNFALTLKTVFVKVMQDFYRFNTCHRCSSNQIADSDNDAMTTLGLFEFVVSSWNEYYPPQSESNIQSVYDSWFTKMKNSLIDKTALFVV